MHFNRLPISGTQLMINDAWIFESNFQGALADMFPQLKKAADMQRLSQNNNIITIQSVKGVSFRSFAKSYSFDKGKHIFNKLFNWVMKFRE